MKSAIEKNTDFENVNEEGIIIFAYKRTCPYCGRSFTTPYKDDLFCTWDCCNKYWKYPSAWEELNDYWAPKYDMDLIPMP